MNIINVLACVILCLSLYNWIMAKLVDARKVEDKQKRTDTQTNPNKLDAMVQLVAVLIFCALLFYWLIGKAERLRIILFVPSVTIYLFVFLSAISTVSLLVMSKGSTPLTDDESGSLILIGMILGVFGLLQPNNFETIFGDKVTIWGCLLITLEYSVFVFLVGALVIRPVKDCASVIIRLVSKKKEKYVSAASYIASRVSLRKRKCVLSELVFNKRKTENKLIRSLLGICYLIVIPIDVVGYIIQYALLLFFWLPVAVVTMSITINGKSLLAFFRWICGLSSRRMTVISFRIAIMTAMLTVVILNRYEYIQTTEATTSILEFIASVVIIPIVFVWIQAAMNSNKELKGDIN